MTGAGNKAPVTPGYIFTVKEEDIKNEQKRKTMKKAAILSVCLALCTAINAQQKADLFKGYLYNSEYRVFMHINFTDNNVVSARQPIFGEMPGYFGAERDPREWFITKAKVSRRDAKLYITNDYGSEDLTATLTCNNDSTYTLTQDSGSRLRIAVNRKWVKIPTRLVFVKK